jgi:hypothetical protein
VGAVSGARNHGYALGWCEVGRGLDDTDLPLIHSGRGRVGVGVGLGFLFLVPPERPGDRLITKNQPGRAAARRARPRRRPARSRAGVTRPPAIRDTLWRNSASEDSGAGQTFARLTPGGLTRRSRQKGRLGLVGERVGIHPRVAIAGRLRRSSRCSRCQEARPGEI